jgi:hypothetical protein
VTSAVAIPDVCSSFVISQLLIILEFFEIKEKLDPSSYLLHDVNVNAESANANKPKASSFFITRFFVNIAKSIEGPIFSSLKIQFHLN